MSEWDEKKFFEKACALRKELSDSDSELKDIELHVLSQIVEQVFFEGGTLPTSFTLTPYPRRSHSEFFESVDIIFSNLGFKYTRSRQFIATHTTQNDYFYTNSNYVPKKRKK